MANPGLQHWKAVKRTFRYLQGTHDLGLKLGGKNAIPTLKGYSDSDWGSSLDDRKSTTGFVFDFGCPISWQSKKLLRYSTLGGALVQQNLANRTSPVSALELVSSLR